MMQYNGCSDTLLQHCDSISQPYPRARFTLLHSHLVFFRECFRQLLPQTPLGGQGQKDVIFNRQSTIECFQVCSAVHTELLAYSEHMYRNMAYPMAHSIASHHM